MYCELMRATVTECSTILSLRDKGNGGRTLSTDIISLRDNFFNLHVVFFSIAFRRNIISVETITARLMRPVRTQSDISFNWFDVVMSTDILSLRDNFFNLFAVSCTLLFRRNIISVEMAPTRLMRPVGTKSDISFNWFKHISLVIINSKS